MTSDAAGTMPFHSFRVSRTLAWYARRASVMSPAELISRAGEQCALKAWQVGHRFGWLTADAPVRDAGRLAFCVASTPQLPELPWALDALADSAEGLVEGRFRALGHEWAWSEDPDIWRRAPDTGRLWPNTFFASIPYREGNPYGDVRVAWEPARLQHLIALALISRTAEASLRRRAVQSLEARLRSWRKANPFLTGIHYISAMECALRLLAVCHAIDIARPWLSDPEGTWPVVTGLIRGHAEFIRRRLSIGSSLGNHTVAEAAGLVYAGILFPELQGDGGWSAAGLRLLEHEASHQILDDGGGAEQGFRYQRVVSDLYRLVVALLRQRNRPVPAALERAVARSQAFDAAFGWPAERWPAIGDGDDGYALSPFLRFPRGEPAPVPATSTFRSSGYTVVTRADGARSRLIFDHGPLGMAPCYAHGHADALSVLLDIDDLEVLIDPGTYTYTGEPSWRRYFRGTSAHNTVTVDGLDQAVQEAAFLWTQPFYTRLAHRDTNPDGSVALVASHDGYLKRLGVLHWRALLYQPPSRWVILDRLTGRGVHRLDANWHLGADPFVEAGSSVLRSGATAVRIDVTGGAVSWHRGETDPPSGWRSPAYGVKVPIATVRCRYEGPLPHEFVTVVRADHDGSRRWVPGAALARLRRLIDEAGAY
ncbi:MAG: alginate lyase family protein [Nitrospirota bacterium]